MACEDGKDVLLCLFCVQILRVCAFCLSVYVFRVHSVNYKKDHCRDVITKQTCTCKLDNQPNKTMLSYYLINHSL